MPDYIHPVFGKLTDEEDIAVFRRQQQEEEYLRAMERQMEDLYSKQMEKDLNEEYEKYMREQFMSMLDDDKVYIRVDIKNVDRPMVICAPAGAEHQIIPLLQGKHMDGTVMSKVEVVELGIQPDDFKHAAEAMNLYDHTFEIPEVSFQDILQDTSTMMKIEKQKKMKRDREQMKWRSRHYKK